MKVFITGGRGFLGSRVVSALQRRDVSVVALDRSGAMQPKPGESNPPAIVRADLFQPEVYSRELSTADVVVHLAALTGRGTREEHFRVNAEGTEALLGECRRAGVKRVLFVSSIAAKFPPESSYYYAQAKLRAEESVRGSGLRFTIVRPTIILGRSAPVLKMLEKLASLPIIPILGNGKAVVQPIYVDDLAELIVTIVLEDLFRGDTLELGGPSAISLEHLIQEIRRVRKGSAGPAMHLPLGPLAALLQVAEGVGLGRFLPVSAGQLSSFRYDGTIDSNPLYEQRRLELRSIKQMLDLSLAT